METRKLETRKPAPKKHNAAEFFAALKALGHDVDGIHYWCCAEDCRERWKKDLPHLTDAPHWVPKAVYDQLNGPACHGSKLYTSADEALADLRAVWAEVLGD
jgi:hypothetical protein